MERLFRLSPYHGVDNYFRLHYGEGGSKRLYPCERIEDLDLRLGIIDNNHLNPRRLNLLPKDRLPIKVNIPETSESCELHLPGKSAIICLTPENCGPELVKELVTKYLSGQPDRRDHLHMSTVQKINDAGWVAFWAPLQLEKKILHVRMVAQRTIHSGDDPREEEIKKLAEAFTRAI